MPSIAFVDEKVNEELEKMPGDNERTLFPEHSFLLSCLKLGLSIQDLKFLTYIDVLKIFLSIEKTETKDETTVRSATQNDIDRLLG